MSRRFLTWLILFAVAWAIGAWVLSTIKGNVEEHRHCGTFTMSSIERAERAERNARGEVDKCHESSVVADSARDHVRGVTP